MRQHDGLRRNRKALLSDLSSLVKTAKSFQEIANGTPIEHEVEYTLDEMLLKSFKVVTRGVRFLDVWNEEVGLTRTIAELERANLHSRLGHDVPPTPASATFSVPENATSEAGETERTESRQLTRSRMDASRASTRMDMSDNHPRPPSATTHRMSVSHRVSYSGTPAAARNPNLASERLNASYDGFLGVLGSFIGLHLQSRSSTELVVTTQQSVQSCRSFLTVVEAVCEHDLQHSEALEQAKDRMYERLSDLVQAAREAFRPSQSPDEEIVIMPDEGKRLVDAATDCVRAAGNCLAKARLELEQIGDFELEAPSEENDPSADTSDAKTPQPQHTSKLSEDQSRPKELTLRVPPPSLHIPNSGYSPSTPGLTDATTPCSFQSRVSPAAGSSDLSSLPSTAMLSTSLEKLSFSSGSGDSAHRNSHPKSEASDSFGRGVTSLGSSFTYNSNTRDSEMSGVSQTSTRATSPDIGNPYQVPSLKGSISHSTLAEENEETEAKILEKTFAHELVFKDGQVVGGSLRALVEKLTAHQATPDAMFVFAFYLTFRLFSSPVEFAQALAERFDYIGETPHAAGPVRLRVYNVYKGWLESHWRHDCDSIALDFVMTFAKTTLMATLPSAGKRLAELVDKVILAQGPVVPRLVSSIGKTNTATAQYVHPDTPLPPPILNKKDANLLKQWRTCETSVSILDFDPLELARQFTLKASRLYCAILPEELLAREWMKTSGSLAVNVRAMSTLSTDMANLVADSILQLEEPKKRAAIIKHWIKIANKCLELNNYDTILAILSSLNSATIFRLKRTWEAVSQKTKATLDQLQTIMDHSRNYAVLKGRIQDQVPPCLPFVGMYLTYLNFVDVGNQPSRNLSTGNGEMTVINFDKHMRTARIISDLLRFQIPYRLTEVPELQAWMQDELVRVRSNGEMSLHTFYRRSVVLEPREANNQRPTLHSESSTSILENAKDKLDFLSWAHHSSKQKSVAAHG